MPWERRGREEGRAGWRQVARARLPGSLLTRRCTGDTPQTVQPSRRFCEETHAGRVGISQSAPSDPTRSPSSRAALRHGHAGPCWHRVGPQRLCAGGVGHLFGGIGGALSRVRPRRRPPPRSLVTPSSSQGPRAASGRAGSGGPSGTGLTPPVSPAVQGPALLPGRPAPGGVLCLRVVPGHQGGGLEPQQSVPGSREL